jgi:hypothetical protein
MNRVRTLVSYLLALLAFPALWAAPAADPRGGAAPIGVNGVYAITFNVKTPANLPLGATILCRARVAPHTPSLENLRLTATPEVVGQASVVGSTANCHVQVPFAWVVNDYQGGVAVSYEIDAISRAGALPVSVLRQTASIASYPAAGSATSLQFQLAF